jgi:hypothetical protein
LLDVVGVEFTRQKLRRRDVARQPCRKMVVRVRDIGQISIVSVAIATLDVIGREGALKAPQQLSVDNSVLGDSRLHFLPDLDIRHSSYG